MSIVTRALAFVQSLRQMAQRRERDYRVCPRCGGTRVYRHGTYPRHPWTLQGQRSLAVPRYRCQNCKATYFAQHPDYPHKAWYARSVRRYALDQYLHGGTSLRRVAELVRSLVGQQERWQIWLPLSPCDPQAPRCTLSASTVQLWLAAAGQRAEQQLEGMYADVPASGLVGTDGLWARLRGGTVRVLLLLRDSATGLWWPPVVAAGEEAAAAWAELFAAAQWAGLPLAALRAVVSDGAQGLLSYLRQALPYVYQQRCVFHLWRNLSGALARQAAQAAPGLEGEAARQAREAVRRELVGLVHGVLDAADGEQAEQALTRLQAHPQGQGLWQVLNQRLIEICVHTMADHQGLGRVSPEWMWRDYRLRLSRGRNHGSAECLRRSGLVFSIYRNFTPAQRRRERRRHYRYPGQSALEVAGVEMHRCSYLDALEV